MNTKNSITSTLANRTKRENILNMFPAMSAAAVSGFELSSGSQYRIDFEATKGSNQALQPTAGRRTASLHFMKTRPLQFTHALASGG
jgi:hypothetical protein